VFSISDLCNLDIEVVAQKKGVGTKKIAAIEQLVSDARKLANCGNNPLRKRGRKSSISGSDLDTPLVFVPHQLKESFRRLGIDTVGKLVFLEEEDLRKFLSFGERKANATIALRFFYETLFGSNSIDDQTTLRDIVPGAVLPKASLGKLTIAEFISGANDKELRGSAKQDALLLRSLLYRRCIKPNDLQGIANMNWRDVPLRITKRAKSFLDKYSISKLRDVDAFAVSAHIKAPNGKGYINALAEANFAECSLESIRDEMTSLKRYGLERYRFGEAGRPKNCSSLVEQACAQLDSRDAAIVKYYLEGRTLQQVANIHNISRERVRQIFALSLENLAIFTPVAREILAPVVKMLDDQLFVPLSSFVTALGCQYDWEVRFAVAVSQVTCHEHHQNVCCQFTKSECEDVLRLLKRLASYHQQFELAQIGTVEELLATATQWLGPTPINARLQALAKRKLPPDTAQQLLSSE
jgi:hypothetical protein